MMFDLVLNTPLINEYVAQNGLMLDFWTFQVFWITISLDELLINILF